jgi:hypothetical protein
MNTDGPTDLSLVCWFWLATLRVTEAITEAARTGRPVETR